MAATMREVINPGSWLGVFGGGQLGRMFTHAAQRMGYNVAILDPQEDCPAAQAANRHFMPKTPAEAKVLTEEMARLCSVVTLEFENVDAELVRLAGRVTRIAPDSEFLEMCQDRISEKTRLKQAGFPTTPFEVVTCEADVHKAAKTLGWPMVLKTARSGYDGKGQTIVRDAACVPDALKRLDSNRIIAEKMIDFESEVSAIVARNAAGEFACYSMFENEHSNHILSVTRCPVSAPLRDIEDQGISIAQNIAQTFGVIGLFCVEFFVTRDRTLMINEIAPRPHNSGHLTIEAFTASQFEQQVRAICNLPLDPCELKQSAAMVNILGDVWESGEPNWSAALTHGAAKLHLYGKAEPRPDRKMGHLTVVDQSSSEAAITAKEIHDKLMRPPEEA